MKLEVLCTTWYILLQGSVSIHKDTWSIFAYNLRIIASKQNQKLTFFIQESDLKAKAYGRINSGHD